jgi:thiol-disulfide isomerase/thioredoxin
MSSGKIILITLLAGIVSVGGGVLGHKFFDPQEKTPSGDPLIPQPLRRLSSLPDFSLPDLQGNLRHSSHWAGKVLLINYWATWCPPCRKEMPAFIELQNELGEKGLQFIGIAIDEAEATKSFAEEIGVNYPILIGNESSIEMSKQLGNRFQGLPFSVIADRSGKIIYTQAGELTPETIRKQIEKLI